MPLNYNWRKIDQSNRPYYLNSEDYCLYYMDYKSKGGYSYSPANQRVSNFKKDPKYRGQNPWTHKLSAVNDFADDLVHLFRDTRDVVICFVPSSKQMDDPEYDERFDLLKTQLLIKRSDIKFEEPIRIVESRAAAHLSANRPTPDEIKQNYAWGGFASVPNYLFIIDDVITSGAQFRACSDFVQANHPQMGISGIFWAKTYWNDSDLL